MRQVPVLIPHALCDLTGVHLCYPGHGGAVTPRPGHGTGNSKGFQAGVDRRTLDVGITVRGPERYRPPTEPDTQPKPEPAAAAGNGSSHIAFDHRTTAAYPLNGLGWGAWPLTLVTIWWAMSRSLVLRFWEAVRKTANARLLLHRSWAMMMPSA